jgi:hypothetical protein
MAGPGFVKIGGKVVGGPTAANVYRNGATPPGPPTPWTPPPIPVGDYNPVRDNELAEGKLSTDQVLTGDERRQTNAENGYATNLTLLQQKEAAQKQTGQETLARLAEGYRKLGTRQTEGANAAGELQGGALLASALKRNANEGVTKGADERNLSEQLKADENQKGQISVDESQLVGPGGSLTEAMQNARQALQQRDESIGMDKGVEAAKEHEYEAPTGPPKVAAAVPARSASPVVKRPPAKSGGSAHPLLAAAKRRGRGW